MRRRNSSGWPQRIGGARNEGSAVGIEYLLFDFYFWFADQVEDQPLSAFCKAGRQIVKI